MIRSMTGYGSADGTVAETRVTIELRSVNHRFFSPSLKLPSLYARWEHEVRESLRKRLGRGHVTLSAHIEQQTAVAAIDEERFSAYVARLRELQRRHDLDGGIDLATVLRLPEVVTTRSNDEPPDDALSELLAIVERAADALMEMRTAEGARLATYLRERLEVIESAVARIASRAPARVQEHRDRLRQSVLELAGGVAVDEQRLAAEIAILADRLDVEEEIARFHSHFAAFRVALAGSETEGVGKRLGFLLQELLREANTTGSKANDAEMTRDVLLVKEELERVREQVENLE
jgi:uncharacterized protein (TIGR00255 family)